MSRNIPVGERPLTEEEIEYLDSRGRRADIILNERMLAEGEFDKLAAEDDDAAWVEEVEELTVAELRQELGDRGLDTTGNKAELQNRLYEAGPKK